MTALDTNLAERLRAVVDERHDALHEAGTRLLRGDLAPAGGTVLTMLVRFSADQLPSSVRDAAATALDPPGTDGPHDLGCSGIGATAHGGLISLERLGPDLCEAEITTTAHDERGGVLAFGRSRRLASKSQRLAPRRHDRGRPRMDPTALDRPAPSTPTQHGPPAQPRLRRPSRLRPVAIRGPGRVRQGAGGVGQHHRFAPRELP